MTSDAGWSHDFTLLKLAPAMIWQRDELPAPFAGAVTVVQENGESSDTESVPPVATSPVESPQSAYPPAGDGVDALLDLLGTPDTTPLKPPSASEDRQPEQERSIPDSTHPIPSAPSATNEMPSGEHFGIWLRQCIERRTLVINDAKALVHTVADTAYLVSPGVFQRYAQEHPKTAALARQEKLADWQWIQRRFEKLQLHRKQASGLNIWTCEVTGPRKTRRLHGYLIKDPRHLFENTPPNNPYLSLRADE